MRKSTPPRRKALFVFGPPLVALLVGAFLIIQALSADAQPESSGDVAESPEQSLSTNRVYSILGASVPSSEWVVVNKSRPLPETFIPSDLRIIRSSSELANPRKLKLQENAASALEEMAEGLASQGAGNLFVNSAYRSYDEQAALFISKTKQYGEAVALVRSAKAGFSEHQTGLAVDVSAPEQGCVILKCFGNTKAGKWLAENSWRFGFIIRYEIEATPITGYTYEPWHLRYIGEELARIYHQGDFHTLEELWNLPPAPDYPQD
ncbi:MAG: hypothetical protein RI917_738 [Actinomycetota bacterium]